MDNVKDYIKKTELDNNDITGNISKEFSTNDACYVLSIEEFEKYKKYIFDNATNKVTDFAILSGADVNFNTSNIHSMLRSYKKENLTYSKDLIVETETRDDSVCVNPVINLDLSIIENLKLLKHVNSNGEVIRNEFYLGEYPQTHSKIDDKLNELLDSEQLKRTNQRYVDLTSKRDDNSLYIVYEYENEKYVLVDTKNVNSKKYTYLQDKTHVSPNNSYWIKVEPIKWKILNWDEMPKHINPKGNGNATHIVAQTSSAIISGLAFYNFTHHQVSKSDAKFSYLWQNSSIRAYLNGYNLEKEIKKANGVEKYKVEYGSKFSDNNFLTDAFSNIELKKENEIVSEIRKRKQNRYGITVNEKPLSISEQIKFYIETGKSFMLHGPSGIGKTRRIEEIDPDFVSIVLRNGMLPEEVIGKQIYPNNDKTTTGIWTPPSWYSKLCELCEKEPNKNHVLFIDEITNVKPTEQSLVYNLVLTHSIGPNIGKLPKNVVVVAAGNSKEESESAYNMPEPLFRRFEAHIELPLNIQDWLIWGSEPRKENSEQTKIHPLVSAFVATYGDKVFYTGYDSEEPPKFAVDPRGWEQISDIIYSNNGIIAKELIENKVGEDIAASFIKFAQNPPLTLDDVLEGEYSKEDIPLKYDAKYALAMGLRNATEEQVKPVREFISKHLGNELLSVFDSAWVGDSNERAILIANQSLENEETNSKYKITIENFFKSEEKLAINADNEKKANILCEVFDKMGKRWADGSLYVNNNRYKNNGATTCYSNDGKCAAKSGAKAYFDEKYTIYEFDEVDMSSYIDTKNYEITFEEFLNSKEHFAIYVKNPEQSKILKKICSNREITNIYSVINSQRHSGMLSAILNVMKIDEKYYLTNFKYVYDENNNNTAVQLDGYTVYDFDEVDFSEELEKIQSNQNKDI